jgi:type VI secretion system secreted protein VgrG
MSEPIAFVCKSLGPCRVVRASGVEAMNALPAWSVEVLSSEVDVDLDALVQQGAAIGLTDDGGGPARVIPLIVTHASYAGPLRDEHRYEVELSSEVWPLSLRSGYRMFQKKTAQEIVAEVLSKAGIAAKHVSWRLAGRYALRVQCVQYAESEWGFIERLLADEGISYWCDAAGDEPLLVFGDSPGAHDGILGDIHVPFADASGMSGTATSFFALSRADELSPDAVHLRDYDVRHPDVLIEGKAGDGAFELYEFPASVPHAEAAGTRAAVRLEQLRRLQVSAHGRSGCTRLQPGRVVRIDGAADEGFNGEWLIVELRHEIEQSWRGESAGRPYRNTAVLVPRKVEGKDRCFRPAPPASRPRIEGLETAVVTGPPGEEIHVNALGSVKLAFPWDPSGTRDDTSSRWARTLQMNMGGSMLLPRVGWEVGVGYVDGNPDEPFVLGQVYNAVKAPPYPMPAKKASSALRSDTSPHDGSTNEVRFGDGAGGQEMFVHASNTQAVSVGASASTTVGANETHDIKKGYGLHVKGAQTITVGAVQNVDVGSDAQTLVKGARSESISAVEDIGVKANRRVHTGAYTETVGGLYGLQCNETATTVKGAYMELVGGSLTAMAGLGTHESVAAARIEVVAGARNVVAGGRGYAEEVWGGKVVSVGACKETAAGNIETAATAGSITVHGSASISAGGKIQIEAPTITIKVGGSLTAKGGSTAKISGSLKVDGGTTKLDASTTTRTKKSKVEA